MDLYVDIVSSSNSIFSGRVKFITLPGELGELGVLKGHVPLISRIIPGMIKILHHDDSEQNIFVAGGILEVQPNLVTVLADTAIRAEDLDESKALEARKKAEDALKNSKNQADISVVEAELIMLIEQARAAKKFKYKNR
ncbi:MAG: F0F1 ATP synthase subunit epsilon [Bordetella sp.]|nr:MAG: F0F1 ATP synthase subunit epsilon [Bordetella sp.]